MGEIPVTPNLYDIFSRQIKDSIGSFNHRLIGQENILNLRLKFLFDLNLFFNRGGVLLVSHAGYHHKHS